ncbi:MAG TPA: serine hydrolase domain-containing protein [Allosphingosinicella sp.]
MRFLIAFCCALALVLGPEPAVAQRRPAMATLLEETRHEIGVPGMAASIWRRGRAVEAAAGERALGSGVAVAAGDPFHIGSIAKPFAATLAARLVERGLLSWSDTVGARLGPSIEVAQAYRGVTLADLLAHRGGIGASPHPDEEARLAGIRDLPGQRLAAARLMLNAPPAGAPERTYLYSNYSYLVAAAMMERATGRAFEDLLRDEVLAPLRLTSAGFGAPGRGTSFAVPWGHSPRGPIPPNAPSADNAAFMRPAGGLHMSMADLARFGADQIGGAGRLLAPDSYRMLQGPVARGRAIGWPLAPGGELFHDGTNLRWFALLRVFPEERLVIAIAANSTGAEIERTRRALWALSDRLRRLP